jgi:hypothetical protein
LLRTAENKKSVSPEDFVKPGELLTEAYKLLKSGCQKDDVELLHCGIQLANTLNLAGRVVEGAKILSEVTEEAKKFKLTNLDLLWSRASLCVSLVEQLVDKPYLDGERLKNFRDSILELKVPIRLVKVAITTERDIYRLSVALIKHANRELNQAQRIVNEERRDPLVKWREIQILEQKLRIAALPNDEEAEKKCALIEKKIKKLQKDRNQAAGNLEGLNSYPPDSTEP